MLKRMFKFVWLMVRVLFALALAAGVPFGLVAFVEWSIDPALWSWAARAVLAVVYALLLAGLTALGLAPDGKAAR